MKPLSYYFSKVEYDGRPFVLFGRAHLLSLGVIFGLAVGWFWLPPLPPETAIGLRIGFGVLLWVIEIGWHIWNIWVGDWHYRETLPLHVCSALMWLTGWMLITGNYEVWLLGYFFGIPGGFFAVLTPDSGQFGFPHYRYVHTMLSHGLLINAPLFMVAVFDYRPTLDGLVGATVVMLVFAAVIFWVNLIIGSNYLYLREKPKTASPFDWMPDWPRYIAVLLAMMMVFLVLLYAPWAIMDWFNSSGG